MAHTGLGLLSAFLAALFFGSNFVVIKEYDMGDGLYWQFVNAVGIWFFGLVTVLCKCIATGSTTYFFHPIALTSGIIWSIGNILTVPIIKTVGLALGMSIWCATQLIVGWSTGKWGLLGTPKDTTVKHNELNYIGVALVFISLVLFFRVRPDIEDENAKKNVKERYRVGDSQNLHIPRTEAHIFNPSSKLSSDASKYVSTVNSQRNLLISQTSSRLLKYDRTHELQIVSSWVDRLRGDSQRNMIGISCSILAGVCYGLMFCPVQYVIHTEDTNTQYSHDMIDYVFAVYNGIFLSSLVFFLIYNLYMKNKPQINTRAVFPSIIGGVVWAIAMDAYFIAMDKNNLGVETTFPIVSAGPQIISSLWGVLYYKEITGKRNILYLCAAITCSLLSVVLVTLSKFDL
eukprot:56151_1